MKEGLSLDKEGLPQRNMENRRKSLKTRFLTPLPPCVGKKRHGPLSQVGRAASPADSPARRLGQTERARVHRRRAEDCPPYPSQNKVVVGKDSPANNREKMAGQLLASNAGSNHETG
jgi:hypothetical protein